VRQTINILSARACHATGRDSAMTACVLFCASVLCLDRRYMENSATAANVTVLSCWACCGLQPPLTCLNALASLLLHRLLSPPEERRAWNALFSVSAFLCLLLHLVSRRTRLLSCREYSCWPHFGQKK